MKKMTAVGMVFTLMFAAFSAYAADSADLVKSAWQARRANATVENTVWKMENYARTGEVCPNPTEEVCYAPTGIRNTFAQSIMFDGAGNDGVWTHFIDGDTAKGKGFVMRINGKDLAGSDRNFCRAMSAVDRVRAIRIAPKNQIAIDPAIAVSWPITMIQTGAELYTQASYDAVQDPPHHVPRTTAIRVTMPKMPVYIAYVDAEADIIRQIDLLDAQGGVAWVVKNRATKISETSWAPSEMFIVNVEEQKAVMMQEVSYDAAFPKNYTPRDLPCGQK